MDIEQKRNLILQKVSKMRRLDIEKKIFETLQENQAGAEEFLNNHLNSYQGEPSEIAKEINSVLTAETSLGILFKDLITITSDKIGSGEVLLSLCIKDAASGGTEDTDIIMEGGKSYEVKKISKGGIFSFSERFTEYNDLGLIMNMAIMNFGHLGIFGGKNLYTVSAKEVRTFKMLIEKFLLKNDLDVVPFYKNQSIVKINNSLFQIENRELNFINQDDRNAMSLLSMFNFRDQIYISKIKQKTMELFKRGYGDEGTQEQIDNLFSITALKQILKGIEGIFLVTPDYTISYMTPHEDHKSLYDPKEISLYDISRNKMNFKGPFLKGSRPEKTPGELPYEFIFI
jgi:hypothetical protein